MSYRRELEKYRDLDEDEILGALTEEELRTLENELDELDPDVSRHERGPCHDRCRDTIITTWGRDRGRLPIATFSCFLLWQ